MNQATSNLMSPMPALDPVVSSLPPIGEPRLSSFAQDCIDGLSRDRKSLPCKWLYDDAGSQLFERITALDEYYPSRAEEALLEKAAACIADLISLPTTLVELGSGASRKTRLLLGASDAIAKYVPVDISAEELARASALLRADFPHLAIMPVCADFTVPSMLELNDLSEQILFFFPGSTLGNMAPPQAIELLSALREIAGSSSRLLLGVDLLKDEHILTAAYDDAAGITAAFNVNLLARMNRELVSTIDVSAFRHRAVWNADESRIEMHLEAKSRQVITLLNRRFVIEVGETIHTENSYKLTAHHWQEIFETAGWRMEHDWQSPAPHFLLALLSGGHGERQISQMEVD